MPHAHILDTQTEMTAPKQKKVKRGKADQSIHIHYRKGANFVHPFVQLLAKRTETVHRLLQSTHWNVKGKWIRVIYYIHTCTEDHVLCLLINSKSFFLGSASGRTVNKKTKQKKSKTKQKKSVTAKGSIITISDSLDGKTLCINLIHDSV